MATGAMVNAAFGVVLKALAPLTNHLLKQWAASVNLGKNVSALELELLSVKALLEHALGREIDNSGLKELLLRLQELGYDAEDLLDELDYFRIQDDLDGESEAADRHAKGCAHNLALNLRHTAKAVGKHFSCSCLQSVRDDDGSISMHNDSPHRSCANNEPPKLRFDRVDASKRMQHIVEKLQRVRAHVSTTIAAIGSSSWSPAQNIAESRPITTSESIELKLYGRERNLIMNSIIHDITRGNNHSGSKAITVIPIVGPGGIGKTTLAQHIYHDQKVQDHFDVKIWTCVSLNFNANKLIENIEKDKFGGYSGLGRSTAGELIRQQLKHKRFLLVLDDVWDCSNEDEWKRLLLPFERSEVQGNIILVTTRFPAQAQMVKTIDPIYLKGLDHEEFSELFQEIVFGSDQCRKDHKFLMETGNKIVARLKGSPLAAKTVGRLLKSQLDLVHWTRVLESREWEQKDGKNDIMPALKLSYDYLPLHLKQCFPYCALFPQDYRFKREELINFWIGIDVLHSPCGENRRVEDIGLSHLTELVNHGFFEKEGKEGGSACYVIHDLLHELALKVSSHECLSIDSSQSQLSSLRIMPSIRHLSINIDDASVDDRFIQKNCVEDFNKLGTSGLKVEKLRTLILLGKHQGLFVKAFGDLFREAKSLRVIILSEANYDVENLLWNFYNLIHLRYLRIQSSLVLQPRFPNKISKFYHMMVLDAKLCGAITDLPRDMTNLVKLRHFLVSNDEAHSSIFEVGKLKSLQELRRFVVKQESQGFDLSQIGHLVELGGSLCISNLENVQVKEEADEAKLMQKSRLNELILRWKIKRSNIDSTLEEHVLERLKPSSSLLNLSIEGNRGSACPSWLGINLSVKSLESLCLKGVAWKTFPPIGLLWLVNESDDEIFGNIPDTRFEKLKRLELVKLPLLKRWAVACQLFRFLEVLVIKNCPELEELSFSHSACCQKEREAHANLFPRLSGLEIGSCPRLLSFPPVPWTEAPCSIVIGKTGNSYFRHLSFSEYNLIISAKNTGGLEIEGEDTRSSMFWNVLDFHNLRKLKRLNMENCLPLPLHQFRMLTSLRTLSVSCESNAFPFVEGDSHDEYQFPVETLYISQWNASGKELTRLLMYFPKLSCLQLKFCEKIIELGVMGQQATATYGPSSSSADKVDEDAREQKDEIVALAAKELLLLPPQLQELDIAHCRKLILRYNPLGDKKEDGRRIGKRVGLQGLSFLRQLHITNCPKLFSSYSSSSFSSCFPFPNSLQHLSLNNSMKAVGMEQTPMPLSNLLSLTSLSIIECRDLRGEGLFPLLARGHLTSLDVTGSPNFFVGSKPSQVHEQELPSRSSKLQDLIIEDVAGFTATPVSTLLFDALTALQISDEEVERFTKEQEALLFVDSLEVISFSNCRNLQCLPPRLHALPNLKRLNIWRCDGIHMLPEDGLPSSLEELSISHCESIRSLPQNCLSSSLQMLVIESCPAIQSLPQVEDLPTSLRKLYVRGTVSQKLMRQCRKMIGTIPTVGLEEAVPWLPLASACRTINSE